ncbi:unnamed protein product [Mytilus edulis]|nr:unnamed protein product [Mytilus edulis]
MGSVCSSLLFITYIRHSRRHADIQQVHTEGSYYEIGTMTSHERNLQTMPTSSESHATEHDIPQQNISNDNEASSETECSDDGSNRSAQGQQGHSYENAYQPLDINGTEIHVYDETRVLSPGYLPNYINTQIFNTDV